MSENENIGYGFEDDNQESGGGLQFGLNAGVTNMVKFEFTENGGKDGAAQEALDIVFKCNGRDISYRMFPVTKAYDDKQNEVTDVRHPAMKKAMKDFNAVIVHILHAFVSKEGIKTALSAPITSFKQFCTVAQNILPANYAEINLDIFAQWQWQITGDNDKTYLRFPKNMKHGRWLCAHIPPVGGEWKESRLNGSLSYLDDDGNKHPFSRAKWFMENAFAEQQSNESLDDIGASAHATADSPAATASGDQKWE